MRGTKEKHFRDGFVCESGISKQSGLEDCLKKQALNKNLRLIRDLKNSKQSGITMIALIITIIVMIVLASVSINAIVGDNGIITQAQNATIQNSIAVLEEYLQEEYIKYYDEANDYSSKLELLIAKFNSNGTNLTLKDGTKNYITYSGKIYYLLNKASLEDEISDQLIGGDTTEYSEYIRLIDVYGITSDLKVYYCSDGIDTILGTADISDVDPNTLLTKVNADSEMKAAITEALSALGITVGENGVTIGNVASLKDLELDGSKYNITSLSALSELNYLKTLTLKNLTLSDLSGLEGCSLLYYIYFKDCTVSDYLNLGSVLDLQYLYIYLSSDINETTANAQIANLGSGLSKATKLDSLEYFGISGYEGFFTNSLTVTDYTYEYTKSSYMSNVTDISPLSNFASNIKSTIKYVFLNNNKFSSVSSLYGFSNIYELELGCNSNLTTLIGLEDHDSIIYLKAHNCSLTSVEGLSGCTGLKYLTLQNNSSLTNLAGLEDSTSLNTLYAYNCDITDITALAKATDLEYLSLYSNVNLVEVLTLGNLVSLTSLYLADNEIMDYEQVRNALADEETHILENCGSNYSIPTRYLLIFSTLTSYDYSNCDLNDDSDEIEALIGKTNVTRLNLSGNSDLSDNKLQELLSSMTGLEALSLNGCTNLSSIDFIGEGKVEGLIELDLRNTSESLTDLSNLNDYSDNLKTLIIDNYNINLSYIQTTINNICKSSYLLGCPSSWYSGYYYVCRGLVLVGDLSKFDFTNCSEITQFISASSYSGFEDTFGSLDLSGLTSVSFMYLSYRKAEVILPCNLLEIYFCYVSYVDFSNCSKISSITFDSPYYSDFIESLFTLQDNLELSLLKIFQTTIESFSFVSSLNSISVEKFEYGYGIIREGGCDSLSGIEQLKSLSYLLVYNHSSIIDISTLQNLSSLTSVKFYGLSISSLQGLENSTNLTSLVAYNNSIGDISSIAELTSLQTLTLYENSISDISALSNLINLTNLDLHSNNISDLSPFDTLVTNSGKTIKFTSLDLSDNLLENYSTNGNNNISTLANLKEAGLSILNISGNNFTDTSELQSLFGSSLTY